MHAQSQKNDGNDAPALWSAHHQSKSGYSIKTVHGEIGGDDGDNAAVPLAFCSKNYYHLTESTLAKTGEYDSDDAAAVLLAFCNGKSAGYSIGAMHAQIVGDYADYAKMAHSQHGSYNSNDANSGNVMAALSTVSFSSDDEIIRESECSGIQHYAVQHYLCSNDVMDAARCGNAVLVWNCNIQCNNWFSPSCKGHCLSRKHKASCESCFLEQKRFIRKHIPGCILKTCLMT